MEIAVTSVQLGILFLTLHIFKSVIKSHRIGFVMYVVERLWKLEICGVGVFAICHNHNQHIIIIYYCENVPPIFFQLSHRSLIRVKNTQQIEIPFSLILLSLYSIKEHTAFRTELLYKQQLYKPLYNTKLESVTMMVVRLN